MAIIDVFIPQMGEGLTEVRILGFQKQPGDTIKRDEPLYSMETDKAVMEVESPHAGTLKEWLADEGAILPIGAPIARLEVAAAEAAAASSSASPEEPAESPAVRSAEVHIPPRTRAYSRQMGISEEEMRRIPAVSGKLMPADVDAYIEAKEAASGETPAAPPIETAYVDSALSPQQRLFVYRLKRSTGVVVPGTIKRSVDWGVIRRCVETVRARETGVRPSEFQTFAYCVAQAVRENPKFRSSLIGDETIREYAHVNLGIAVARANGELLTAVVSSADSLGYLDFIRTAQEQIQAAREGEDQADAATQLLLTYLGAYEVVDAVPVLVAPATAVLFIGSTFERNGELLANLVLTFDHRLVNGVEAAEFLRSVVEKAQQVEQLTQ